MKIFGMTSNDLKSLTEFDQEIPEPENRDILVEVQGVSINPVDIATRKQLDDVLTGPKILGYDGYGRVSKLGPKATKFSVGDIVFFAGDYSRDGSYQEYELIDERLVALAPKKVDIAHSVAMPLVTLTASELLYEKLNIDPNEDNSDRTTLIINGAGGVGSIAIQLAHQAGLKVIATASTDEKVKWVKSLGADYVVDHHKNLIEQVRGLGFHFVDDIIGLSDNDPHWNEIVELIKPFGTFATITNLNESKIGDLKQKSVNFKWEWMFTKAFFNMDEMSEQGQYLEKLSKGLDDGSIRSTMTECVKGFNAANLQKATEMVEAGHMMGKVVVIK
ncbi:zinc-binding alcohol dehydrogenase family protein [Companilactobacillus mishanensis]|uniref:Zinc-type alcohol dehydrogenase-like protein n=1 Tax=Companilactobacillus mishanensis TaxID=2486008 RepID=A0ABW9P844_9LACO|nr:zinc-binding alcohol dehydrogenase family protein [Companilactobacillus mishanensis]MQS45456.1 zinc-binding alcohol dehydrogenase family protein [Companilactobacillus mishanensis]